MCVSIYSSVLFIYLTDLGLSVTESSFEVSTETLDIDSNDTDSDSNDTDSSGLTKRSKHSTASRPINVFIFLYQTIFVKQQLL